MVLRVRMARHRTEGRECMLQGVIFDMDGLLFDTERIWDTLRPRYVGQGI